jgi:signal transduction histidine kinase
MVTSDVMGRRRPEFLPEWQVPVAPYVTKHPVLFETGGVALAEHNNQPDDSATRPSLPAAGLDGQALALLAELAAQLPTCAEPAELQRAVLERTGAILRCDCGATALWDESEETLKPGAVLGEGQALETPDFYTSRPVTARLLSRREGLLFNDPVRELGLSLGSVAALVAVPMVTGGNLVGILVLASREKGRKLSAADQAFVQAVANFAAAVLEATVQFNRFSYDLRARIVEATKELNRGMAELAQVKSFNESIFESIAMGIVVFDRSFNVIFRNRLAEQTFPDERNVVQGLARTSIARSCKDHERMFRDVVRLGQICKFGGVIYEKAGGESLVLGLTASPLTGQRQAVVGGILTIEDLTRSSSMESRLAASERLAAVGKLAAKVAHELNNPLDGILRYISLAARVCKEGPDPRPVGYLEEVRIGLLRMARIISELLEFSRSTITVTQDGSIRRALEEAIKSLAGKAAEQQVTLELEIAADVPPIESSSLYQVFTNLVKNAIEAMPGGGLVRVEALAVNEAVEVRVADSGPGIPKDRLALIFEPFFSTKEAVHGTGLGLAISREIVEKQGGSILARNRAAGGAEFVVRIPTKWVRQGAGPTPGK